MNEPFIDRDFKALEVLEGQIQQDIYLAIGMKENAIYLGKHVIMPIGM